MSSKVKTIYDLKKWILDDGLHIDFREIDGYNKPFNYIICSRSAGKSSQIWKKLYNNFKETGTPSIVLRRKIVDITEQYINDIATLINKFTDNDIELEFKKSNIKQGMLDVFLNGKIFFRVIALSTSMNRLKSMVLRHVKFLIFDEFIINARCGEKYEKNEVFKFQELYNTYNRESDSFIKCYFLGNPYSNFFPYATWLHIDTRKLKKGALLTGSNWLVWCYELKPELIQHLKDTNPLYEDSDSDYVKYAFGEAINDQYIRICENQPQGFRLEYTFKIEGQIVGIFRNYDVMATRPMSEVDLDYWAKVLDKNEVSKYRDIFTFDFAEMMDQTILINRGHKYYLEDLKDAIEQRTIAYQNIDASYLVESIYVNI